MLIDDVKRQVERELSETGNPNGAGSDIIEAIEDAVIEWAKVNGWSEWGDGCWREDTACSICGQCFPGICGHENDPSQIVLRGLDARAAYERFAKA